MVEIKKYLSQPRDLHLIIQAKQQQILKLQQLLENTKEYVNNNLQNQDLQSLDLCINTLQNDLLCEINQYIISYKQIQNCIHRISNLEHRTILELYYIHGCTWDIIAEKTNYSRRHITRLHTSALQGLKQTFII